MVETAKRRRWPWLVLAVLLLWGGAVAVQRLWPLSFDERRLLGTWVLADSSWGSAETTRITFTPDRRFFRSGSEADPRIGSLPAHGGWACPQGQLSLVESPPPRRLHWSIVKAYWNRLLRGGRKASQQVEFEAPDRVRLGGRLWTRDGHSASHP